MLCSILFFLLAFTCSTHGVAVQAYHVVHESRDSTSPRWIRRSRVRPAAVLPVRIGLAQSNLDKAEDYLSAVSSPESPDYGKHWTAEQVIEAFKPSDESIQAVKDWLKSAGINNAVLSDNKAWFAFNTRASVIESLLKAEYHEYEDLHTREIVPSCDCYHVPHHVKKHIDFITPGVKLLAPNGRSQNALRRRDWSSRFGDSAASFRRPLESVQLNDTRGPCEYDGNHPDCLKKCSDAMTPACIAALYSIPPSAILQPNASNIMGIYESEFQRWDQTDLDIFFTRYANGRIPNGTHPVSYNIDGGRGEATLQQFPTSNNGDEASLDLDLAYPIVYPQQIGVWDENDLHYQHWIDNDTWTWGFNQFLDAVDGSYCTFSAYGETGDYPGVDPTYPDPSSHGGYNKSLQCGVFKPPTVLSVSYGGQEADLPIAYQKRQCLEFLKLGLQGTSLLFASGDAGVGNYPQFTGYGTDGSTGCLGPKGDVFNPAWPNTCPWVTNVGGTKMYPGNSVFEPQPESVVFGPWFPTYYNYSSGGGFSNLYPIPDYQKRAVEGYLDNYTPPYKSYARLAANAPNPTKVDIAELQGDTEGLYNRIGRAYPDVSANGARSAVVQHGKPWRWSGTSCSTPIFGAIINRINEERMAVGKGPVGFLNPALYANPWVMNDVVNGSNVGCYTEGFQATPGWDPASGLGTPNYPKMLELFMSLP